MGFCEPHNFEFGKGHEDVSCPYCKIAQLRAELLMARVLCQIYFEIAEEHIPAEKIREKLEEKIQEWTRKLL